MINLEKIKKAFIERKKKQETLDFSLFVLQMIDLFRKADTEKKYKETEK